MDRVDAGPNQLVPARLVIDSRRGAGVPWSGAALVDGKPWAFSNAKTVWLPKGSHVIEHGQEQAAAAANPGASLLPPWLPPTVRVLDFNGELQAASTTGASLDFAYQSNARAIAVLEKKPAKLEIDGVAVNPEMVGPALLLPKGQHLVSLE